jgi:hypothetical protein
VRSILHARILAAGQQAKTGGNGSRKHIQTLNSKLDVWFELEIEIILIVL